MAAAPFNGSPNKTLDPDKRLESIELEGWNIKGSPSYIDAPEGEGETLTSRPFKINPTHSRTLSNTEFNALVDDIRVNGIKEPIKYVVYKGEMYVVDGHHRLLAAKKLGMTDVPIEEVTLPY